MKPITAFACPVLYVLTGFAQRKIPDQMKQEDREISRLINIPFYKRAVETEKKRENPRHNKNHYLKISNPVTLNNPVFTY
jgi:hypothetical protein